MENRTTALRVIRGGASSQRVEYRIAAADINPYIALSAAIGSGLWGIEHRIEPDAPIEGNSYDREHPPERRLPATLYEAAGRLARVKVRARCSATSSSSTTPPPVNGRSVNSARRSPIGNWPDISRSFDHHERHFKDHQSRRRPYIRRAAARDGIGHRSRARGAAKRSRVGGVCRWHRAA
jgi:hypothetical protein